jgi:asparagine synthase (glutamine-hydrolysing)
MCGICGFAGFYDNELLRKMTASIIHRGPDGEGLYEKKPVMAMGMRRLAIIDLKTGDQPIYNEDKSIAVVFNGEIYNFEELRARLSAKGHTFYTKTDTEVIVHLYEEYGEECAKHMRGMFAFAVWDDRKHKLVISRDQIGIKPLYYAFTGGKLLFGSEIKCILQHKDVSRNLNYKALDYYFTFMYIPFPYSIYEGINKLPPAHTLIWENNSIRIVKYWEVPKFVPGAVRSEKYYVENILDLLKKSVSEQKISDVPIGVFLSGGLDSSSIVALLSEISSEPLKTFSIVHGSTDPTYDESKKARLVAEMYKCDHFEHIIQPDIVSIIPKLVSHFDEPFADSSSIPTYLISQDVRRKITVALTGVGGDELFGGYPRYLGARLSRAYRFLPYTARQVIYEISKFFPETTKSRNLPGWIKRFAKGGLLDFKHQYISWVSYLSEAEKKYSYSDDFRSKIKNNSAPDEWFLGGLKDPDSLFEGELQTYLVDDLLCHSDRMSMANSIELRVPFLDTRLIEFMSQVPISMKTKNFDLKYLLKKAMTGKLPDQIINQKKMGFQIPIGRWINEDIQPLINDVLSTTRIKESGFLNPNYVSDILHNHKKGLRNYSDQIYAMLVFELWHDKVHLDKKDEIGTRIVVNETPKKILIVNLGGIGDIIMMVPFVKAMRDYYRDAQIDLLTIPRSVGISASVPGFNNIFTIPLKFKKPSPFSLLQLAWSIKKVRDRKYDVLINLREVQTESGKSKMKLLTRLIAPKLSIGRDIEGRGNFYDFPVFEKLSEHKNEVDLTLKLLAPLGIVKFDRTISYPVFDEDKLFVQNMLKERGISDSDLLIGLNPGAFRPSRRWPANYWVSLIRLLSERYKNAKFFITGETSELSFVNQMKISDNVIITNGTLSFGQIAALLQRLALYITNDTGPMHLGAAVGTKVVAIFGPGDSDRYTPAVPAEQYRVVRVDDVDCARPCYSFECANPRCLMKITPESVLYAAAELLKR